MLTGGPAQDIKAGRGGSQRTSPSWRSCWPA